MSMFTLVSETFETVAKTASIIEAYCDATKNKTILKIKHEDGKLARLVIPTASEKRLSYLTAGRKISYSCTHEQLIRKDNCLYRTEEAASIRF